MTKKFGTVALIGRPNAGKSTLLNYLLGQKISIVSDKPQTTRHRILGVLTENNYQIVFTDLPGFHKPVYEMNKAMMQNVYDGLQNCDLIVYIIDASEKFGNGENYLINQLKEVEQPVIVALNKLDKIKKSRVLPLMETLAENGFNELIPISALTGNGVDKLKELIVEKLPEGEFCYDEDYYTNISEKFFISEIIREKILKETRDELPYTTFVEIRKLTIEEDRVEIFCDIVVEKKSQKPILVGHQGRFIKKIRTESLKELKEYFEKPVDLNLFVRVEKNWRQKQKYLSQYNI
jgi:GTP-binding protein Era